MADVLSEVLDALELESSIYFRAELSSPFSIAVPEQSGVIRFHVASEGRCTLTVDGGESVEFGPGDLVMVPHGLGHVLSEGGPGPAQPLTRILDETGFDGVGPLVYGGGGSRTTLVCGHFGFSTEVTHPFIESLPSVLPLRRGEGAGFVWVEQLLAYTEDEARRRTTGWQSVVERLSQILLINVLRACIERGEVLGGALSALADPQLMRAIQAIHASPATDWTLDTLAQKAGMSRSAFVRRFGSTCGLSPMRYLTMWRMSRARHLLAHTEISAGEVAALVGYASEAAFNRAFKEHFDAPPATFRRRLRASMRELATTRDERPVPRVVH